MTESEKDFYHEVHEGKQEQVLMKKIELLSFTHFHLGHPENFLFR